MACLEVLYNRGQDLFIFAYLDLFDVKDRLIGSKRYIRFSD